jgi:hypothetical protein
MAQAVGYFQDDVVFEEGPFVICNALGNGWRLEVEQKGVKYPVLPHGSIYDLVKKRFGLNGKTNDRDVIAKICDSLNQMARDKEILLVDGMWAHGRFETHFVEGR